MIFSDIGPMPAEVAYVVLAFGLLVLGWNLVVRVDE